LRAREQLRGFRACQISRERSLIDNAAIVTDNRNTRNDFERQRRLGSLRRAAGCCPLRRITSMYEPAAEAEWFGKWLIRSYIESRTYASITCNNVQIGMRDSGDGDSAKRMQQRHGCADSHDPWPGAAVLLHGQLSAVSAKRAHRGWA
jgi:hypothetical protein